MKDSIVRPRMTATNRDQLMAMADTLSDDRQEGIKLVIELAERSGVNQSDALLAAQNADRLQSKVCELSDARAIAENARLRLGEISDEMLDDLVECQYSLQHAESLHKWYFIGGIAAGIISSLIFALAFKLL